MAQFPCDHCGRRYPGPGNRAYVSILDGVRKWEHKPRLCPSHVQELHEIFSAVNGLIDPEDPTPYQSQPCLRCAGSVNGHSPHSVFMTLFTGRDARTDYYAPVCSECRPDAERLLTGFQIAS